MALTANNMVYNWNATTLQLQLTVATTINTYFGATLTYLDFSFDYKDSMAFNAILRFAIVNLTSNTVIYAYQLSGIYQYYENTLT